MATPFQKIIGLIPFAFILVAILTPFITQKIWTKKNYILALILAGIYMVLSLWVFEFDVTRFGFKTSLFPFIYIAYCLLFQMVFIRIKPKEINRSFPIYVVPNEWDESWSKKLNTPPQPADRLVSTWISILTISTTIILVFLF